ncbi:MAG: OB-fold nucleic acid binding domain-containing protein, partial [Dehalococcoidales bacterium]|nr:OB-fold nucleic acid binding domain-containing protein [Dehalococcoidales bacterium]
MTSRLERISQQRLEKLKRLRASGTDPYPHRYQRTHTAEQAVALLKEQETAPTVNVVSIWVAGRIMSHRRMGAISFMDLRDGSGKIQLLFQNINQFDEKLRELFEELDIGDI